MDLVRALTHVEYAMLRGDHVGIDFDADEAEGARLDGVCQALILRGCIIRYSTGDNFWGHSITPLGRLALRVSRPEMAFTVPQ